MELPYLTTFGGHPLSCAAGLAGLNYLLEKDYMTQVRRYSDKIMEVLSTRLGDLLIRRSGFLIAVDLPKSVKSLRVFERCLKDQLIVDGFLFSPQSVRISPALDMPWEVIQTGLEILINAINKS